MKNHGPTPTKLAAPRKVAKFGPKLKPLAERFGARTEVRGDCVVWTGCTNGAGYGMLYDRDTGRKELAHRVAIRLEEGQYPEGTTRHICDNPTCVKYEHLRVGTQADNMLDKAVKRRNKNQYRNATLKQAKRCVKLYDQGYSQGEVGKLVGLDQTTVSRIVRGKVMGLPVMSNRAKRRLLRT